ncbi:MAG: hypothetical protein IJA10_03980 [Lachnospiraceae bacterium]|nr:hypothetical protein [Lachnospiraceae bacterium]
MNIWEILEIDVTNDISRIKKAYRTKLKTTRPDDDEEAFMALRGAYEEALEHAEESNLQDNDDLEYDEDEDWYDGDSYDDSDEMYSNEIEVDEIEACHNETNKTYFNHDLYDRYKDAKERYISNRYKQDVYIKERDAKIERINDSYKKDEYIEDNEDDYNREKQYSREKQYNREKQYLNQIKISEWTRKVDALYNDYNKRNLVPEWKELLYNDIPYQIEYYKTCRKYIYELIFERYKRIYLTREVRIFLDEFFSYSMTPLLRAKIEDDDERKELNRLNQRMKLCENIEFDKLNPCGANGILIDEFFYGYEELIQHLQDFIPSNHEKDEDRLNKVKRLKGFSLTYLPLECMALFFHMNELQESQIVERIAKLKEDFGTQVEIEVLEVQYKIHKDNIQGAREQLKELYQKAPVKNYPALYQMAMCCKDAGMYYEAYMLIKQLTWLNPQAFMHEMAEEVYHKLEHCYLEKIEAGETPDDIEHIHMCRMYLRGNREKEALEVLKRVQDISKYPWEYEVAYALCVFYEESKKVPANLYVLVHIGDAEPPMEIPTVKSVFERLEQYPKEALSTLDRLEWQELQGRYLFEQRKHKECDALCNELLEEYPVSYPILTLRAYADFGANTLGKNFRCTQYMDVSYLVNALPKRREVRLMAAQILCFNNDYQRIQAVLEPIKEEVPDHIRFYEVFADSERNVKNVILGIKSIFEESRNRELDIPAINKYRLLDLRNMFTYACYYAGNAFFLEERKEIYPFFESLKDANYNHPEQYMELSYLYNALDRKDEAAAVELQHLKQATERDKKLIYWRLSTIYSNNLEKLKEYEPYLEERCKCLSMGQAAYYCGEYELAIKYLERADKLVLGSINLYQRLGESYWALGQYDEAIDAFWRGIIRYRISGDSVGGATNSYGFIANIYMDLGCWDEAFEVLQVMKQHTRNPKCLARCYHLLGHWYNATNVEKQNDEKILEAWNQAVELRYENPALYKDMGRIYVGKGEYDKAIRVLDIGIEVVGVTGDYRYGANDEYEDNFYHEKHIIYCVYMKEPDKAIESLEFMRKHSKSKKYQEWYYFRIGFVYWLKGEKYVEQTTLNWMEAVKHKTIFGQAYGYLADAYIERKDYERAVIMLELGCKYAKDFADYGNNENIFWKLFHLYVYQQRFESAYKVACQIPNHTKMEWLKKKALEIIEKVQRGDET